MSKVILVMDDPKRCHNCPLARESYIRDKDRYGYVCGIGHDGEHGDWVWESVDMDSNTKSYHCPLKPVPNSIIRFSDGDDYADGYNDCIDEILGH